jgi:ferredoxin
VCSKLCRRTARPLERSRKRLSQQRSSFVARYHPFTLGRAMPIVHFVNEKKQIEVPRGANLRREALKAGVHLYPGIHQYLNCRGLAQCASCRVLITKGLENASAKGLMEKLRLKVSLAYIGNEETMRLACQTSVNGDMEVVTRPPLNLYGDTFYA